MFGIVRLSAAKALLYLLGAPLPSDGVPAEHSRRARPGASFVRGISAQDILLHCLPTPLGLIVRPPSPLLPFPPNPLHTRPGDAVQQQHVRNHHRHPQRQPEERLGEAAQEGRGQEQAAQGGAQARQGQQTDWASQAPRGGTNWQVGASSAQPVSSRCSAQKQLHKLTSTDTGRCPCRLQAPLPPAGPHPNRGPANHTAGTAGTAAASSGAAAAHHRSTHAAAAARW